MILLLLHALQHKLDRLQSLMHFHVFSRLFRRGWFLWNLIGAWNSAVIRVCRIN